MKYIVALLFVLLYSTISYAQPPAHALWKLSWSDEFNGINADLDTGWNSSNGGYLSTSINCSRWRRNAVVKDGTLKMYYRKEKTSGGSGATAWSYDWTAASISTKRKFKFGYYECRYKIASSKGTNNSFWLISSKNADTSIKTFEIDINEGQFARNSTDTWHQIRTNVHNWSDTFRNSSGTLTHPTATFHTNPSPWYNTGYEYHTMGLEWNEKELIWYVDGKIIRRTPNVNAYRSAVNCFDEAPVLLSGATIPWMSGINGVIPDSVDGKFMEVDYVRIYDKITQPETKVICRGDEFSLTASPGIPDATTYRWQVSIFSNGSYLDWTDIVSGTIGTTTALGIGANYSGVTTNTLTVRNGPNSLQNARFRCRLTTNTLSTTATVPSGSVAYTAPFVRFSDTVSITINQPVVATVNSINSVNYLGSTVRLNATATGGSGVFNNYNWFGPNSFTSSSQLAFISDFGVNNNGTYSVIVTDSLGCKDTASINITAISSNNPPLLISTTTPTTITAFDNLNLVANPSGGSGIYSNFSWIGPNNFVANSQNPIINAATAVNSGVYTVFVTDNAGFTASRSIPITVNKRTQSISFTAISNRTYSGSESTAIPLVATATSNLPVSYRSSNTALISIVGNTFIANRKRPDYSIELPSTISTNKVRIYTTQTAHFHIREFRVFAPNANGYPQSPLEDNADYEVDGLENYAERSTTTVNVSGTFDDTNFAFQAGNANDGIVSTSWVSQTGSTPKFIELTFNTVLPIGCVQFVNGFFSSNVWQGLMTSFNVQYWNGTAWVDIYDCNTTITAMQPGDDNTLAATAIQRLCVNITNRSITNQTNTLPVDITAFTVEENNKTVALQWTVQNEVNVAFYEVQKSINGLSWQVVSKVNASNASQYATIDYQPFLLANKVFYRLRMVDSDGTFKFSKVQSIEKLANQLSLQVFPNPTTDVLKVLLENASTISMPFEISVYDLLGKKVISKTSNNVLTTIHTNTLKAGWYVVEVHTVAQHFRQKFLKQ